MDAPTKTQLAEERTDFAEDRTVLANERTYAGWLRTGYAAVGIALGFQALFGRIQPPWVPKLIATAMLVVAVIIFIAAEQRTCRVLKRLNAHMVQPVKMKQVRLVTRLSIAATVALALTLWFLDVAG